MIFERGSTSLRYKGLSQEDLYQVAKIHKIAFPDSALTKLGLEATRRYYEWQLVGPHDCHAIGIFEAERLLGFCFGGIFHGALNGFLRKNKRFLVFLIITHPWLLTNPLFKERISLAIHSLFPKKTVKPVKSIKSKPSFGILSIAVDPSKQGQGIGGLLMNQSELAALEKGFQKMHLSVHPDNVQAITFYASLGWRKVEDSSGYWNGAMEKLLDGSHSL